MSRGAELSVAIEAALALIHPDNGFVTDIKNVYGFSEAKPDKAPLPCLLVRISDDELVEFSAGKAKRNVVYEVHGIMSRAASLQDIQNLHHDILVALGQGQLPGSRPVKAGWPFEESAEFDPGVDGVAQRSVISSVTFAYVETY